jgi:acyl phosphate:glycerol-3-phosphate acyltransferase
MLHRFLVLSHVLSGFLGYLIGSIPTAFLLVRWKSNIDIRSAGSGNAGALNSFQVTRSKMVGGGVLLLDVLKGAAAVLLTSACFDTQFSLQATAGVAAVAGHNFPVWLKGRGGRGLATAAGVMLIVAWQLVLVWGVLWVSGVAVTKHVNMANAIASAAEVIGVLVVPSEMLSQLCPFVILGEFRLFCLALFSLILVKHIGPVREYLGKPSTLKSVL